MNNEAWNAARVALEGELIEAALNLYEHNPWFAKVELEVPNTTPKLVIVLELK